MQVPTSPSTTAAKPKHGFRRGFGYGCGCGVLACLLLSSLRSCYILSVLCSLFLTTHNTCGTFKNKRQAGDFEFAPGMCASARSLLNCILEPDPTKRYTAAQVRSHPWCVGEGGVENENRAALPIGGGASGSLCDDGPRRPEFVGNASAASFYAASSSKSGGGSVAGGRGSGREVGSGGGGGSFYGSGSANGDSVVSGYTAEREAGDGDTYSLWGSFSEQGVVKEEDDSSARSCHSSSSESFGSYIMTDSSGSSLSSCGGGAVEPSSGLRSYGSVGAPSVRRVSRLPFETPVQWTCQTRTGPSLPSRTHRESRGDGCGGGLRPSPSTRERQRQQRCDENVYAVVVPKAEKEKTDERAAAESAGDDETVTACCLTTEESIFSDAVPSPPDVLSPADSSCSSLGPAVLFPSRSATQPHRIFKEADSFFGYEHQHGDVST